VKKAIVSFGVVLIVLAWCMPGFPWAAEHPARLPVGGSPAWPAGLRELLNREGRVYGFFVNANDFFFYLGDTEALNEFLAQYAKLKDTPLTLVLHSAQGKTGRLGYGEKKIQFDWEVKVLARGWSPEAPPDPTTEKPGYVVIVDLWLGGNIDLDKLKVPLNVKVKSRGEIEKFIGDHEANRNQDQVLSEQDKALGSSD